MGGKRRGKGSGCNRDNGEKIKFHLERQKERKTAERTWVAKHNIQEEKTKGTIKWKGRERKEKVDMRSGNFFQRNGNLDVKSVNKMESISSREGIRCFTFLLRAFDE